MSQRNISDNKLDLIGTSSSMSPLKNQKMKNMQKNKDVQEEKDRN